MQPSAKHIGRFYTNIYTSLAVKDTDSATYMVRSTTKIEEDEETFKNRRFVIFLVSYLLYFHIALKSTLCKCLRKKIHFLGQRATERTK